ncbi:phage tail spike protein [Listeria monocytogenes]
MIPILYSKQENAFNHNGLGLLADCLQASVTEERNGLFELVFKYPVNGPLFSNLVNDSIVKAKPNDNSNDQLFSIYSISKVESGIVTIAAKHISYDLNANPLKSNLKYEKVTPATAITNILKNTVHSNSFNVWSDINTTGNVDYKIPVYAKEAMGGIEGSVLDVFKGEFEFDNKTIKLWKNRGADKGVKIAYGKNLTTATQEEAIDETFTSIYPYKTITNNAGEPELLSLPESIINSDYVANYRTGRTLMVDFTSEESVTNVATLRSAAINYVKNNELGKPRVSLKISFINLWQTESYKDIAALEKVGLCDVVEVHFERIGISTKAKVIKTIYDVLNEKYSEMELGEAKANLADQINQQANDLKDAQLSNAWLAEAVANATELINNAPANAKIVLYPSMANPQEILILVDGDSVETATKLWRWNAGGLGYSKNGYAGPYELAITSDGSIVADMITTGTLKAINMIGVNITGSSGYFDTLYSSFLPSIPSPQYREELQMGGGTGFHLTAQAVSKAHPALQIRMNTNGDLGLAIEAVNENSGVVDSDRVIRLSPFAGGEFPLLYSMGWLYLGANADGRVACIDYTTWKSGGGPQIRYIPCRATNFETASSEEYKKNIRKVKKTAFGKTAKQVITETDVFTYTHIADELNEKKIGFIAEQASDSLTTEDGKAIDLYNSIAWLYQYAKENEEDKKALKNKLITAINEIKQLTKKLNEMVDSKGVD